MAKGSIDIVRNCVFSKSTEADYYTIRIEKDKWDCFNAGFKLEKKNWRTVKFFQSDGVLSPALEAIKDEYGVFMCVLKPDNIPVINYEYVMFIDGTTNGVRKALENFITTKASSYLYNSEIKNLIDRYEDYLYISYYVDKNRAHIEKLKEALVEAINPPIKNNTKAKKGPIEHGFRK